MPTTAVSPARQQFDYSSLDAATSEFVQQQTGEIRTLMKRTAEGIVEIGLRLIEVKQRLGHGRFGSWLEAEFEWSWDTAVRFMNVATKFGDFSQIAKIAPSALYILAAPSTQETARAEALARVEAGESISYTTAKAIKQKYTKPKTKKQPEPQLEPKAEPEPELPKASILLTQSPTSAIATPVQPGTKKLEIVAIRPKAEPTPTESTATSVITTQATTKVPPVIAPPVVPPEPGVWWQLGRHLLYCGDPNSPYFVERVTEVPLLLAFPNSRFWQPSMVAEIRMILTGYLPQIQDPELLDETVESVILLCSEPREMVVSCFIPNPEILSIINRLDRWGVVAEPDPKRCHAVITDWKKAGFKVERVDW